MHKIGVPKNTLTFLFCLLFFFHSFFLPLLSFFPSSLTFLLPSVLHSFTLPCVHRLLLLPKLRTRLQNINIKFWNRNLSFSILLDRGPSRRAPGTPCFRSGMTLPMGFKAKVESWLPALFCRLCTMIPRSISGCWDWALNLGSLPSETSMIPLYQLGLTFLPFMSTCFLPPIDFDLHASPSGLF